MSTVNNVNKINYRIHITTMTCHFHGYNTVNRSQSKLGSVSIEMASNTSLLGEL